VGARARILLLITSAIIAGCAQHQSPVAQAQPVVMAPAPALQPAAPKQPEWNIFPDPISGRVEIYRDGVHVGSVTGDEKEDPPEPRKRDNAGTDSN
jgi:hypothetical protein